MTTRSNLALGRLVLGRFAALGLDPRWFNQRTPLTYELLELVGEDSLVYVEALLEAAEDNLSVAEFLAPGPRKLLPVLYRFEPAARRVARGGASLEDRAFALLYVATYRRVNGRNPVIGERSAERDALTERAAEARDRATVASGGKVGF
jgi:hypothetical protein